MSREDIDPDLELIKTEVESERDEQEAAEPVTEKTFKCPICERTYKCKRYLRDHMNIHKEKFVCQECGLCFRRQSILDAHVLTHSGVKLFSCLNCDEPFANTLDLNRHYKSCLKEENYYPFECEICHQGLKTKLGLQRHLANHNGPYGCDVCGSRYQSSSTLLRHKKIHKERPFSCQKCEFRSVDRQGLTKHQKICRGKKRVARHVLRLDGDEFAVLVRPEDSHLFPYPNIAEEDCLGNHVATELSGRIAEHGEVEEEKRSHGVVPMRKQIYSLLGKPLADDPLLPKLEPSSPAAVHKSPKFSVEEPPVKKNRSGRNIGGLLKQMKEDFDKRLEQQKKNFERRLQLQKELFDKKILLLRNHVEDLAKVVMAIDKEANKLGLELEQFPEQQESNEKEAPR